MNITNYISPYNVVEEAVLVYWFRFVVPDLSNFKPILIKFLEQRFVCIPVSLYVAEIELYLGIECKYTNQSFHQRFNYSWPVYNICSY